MFLLPQTVPKTPQDRPKTILKSYFFPEWAPAQGSLCVGGPWGLTIRGTFWRERWSNFSHFVPGILSKSTFGSDLVSI